MRRSRAHTQAGSVLINYIRRGQGKPLLLIHGLGSSWRSWSTVMEPLAAERAVIAIDLPGFGKSPPLEGELSMRTLADAVTLFLEEHDLLGIDAVGSSMGARLVLELARRGVLGSVVSLSPGGFWAGWERHAFHMSIWISVRLIRGLQFAMPALTARAWARKLLLTQLCAQSESLSPSLVLQEMRSFANAKSFDALLRDLVRGPPQQGALQGSLSKPLVVGWGRLDRLCFPHQAAQAVQRFPDARLHWFERCGHFPHWDAPKETARLILETTSD